MQQVQLKLLPKKEPEPRRMARCSKCGHISDPFENTLREPTDIEGVERVYLVCPECADRTHAYYDNAQLAHLRSVVTNAAERHVKEMSHWSDKNLIRARRAYATDFKVLQMRMKKALPAPKEEDYADLRE